MSCSNDKPVSHGTGNGFVIIVVLYILLAIMVTSWF